MRYSPQQLSLMARRLIKAKQEDNPRYLLFVVNVAAKADVSPDYVEQQITRMASGSENQ